KLALEEAWIRIRDVKTFLNYKRQAGKELVRAKVFAMFLVTFVFLLCEGFWRLPPVSVGLCAAGHSRTLTTHAQGLSAPDIDLNPHECCLMPDDHRSARRAHLPADVRGIRTDQPVCGAAG